MADDRTYGAGEGPAPRPLDEHEIEQVLAAEPFGVFATLRRDGTASQSIVAPAWDAEERVLRISTVEARLKVRHLRRDPRGALLVTTGDHLISVQVEGVVEVGAVSTVVGDDAGQELLRMQGGALAADDADAFLEQMVRDRRLVLRFRDPRLRGTKLHG